VSGAHATARLARFDPASISTFRFVSRSIDADGFVSLRYALDDAHEFEERFRLPIGLDGDAVTSSTVRGLLDLLHWVAGVSYYKAAAPPSVSCESGDPPPAARALLEALYSEGLGEFALVNGLQELPRPAFPAARDPRRAARAHVPAARDPRPDARGRRRPAAAARRLERLLVPVGGGKDSAVAIEIARLSGVSPTLFSIGDPPPIAGTVEVAGLPRLLATRRIDPYLLQCNAAGALNGHVPVTATVACAALLTAALNGLDAVALANERSASSPNTVWNGIEINHQFSKGAVAERLLSAAAGGVRGAPAIFSVLRGASELAIARAFARMPRYHRAFTSCNRVFRIDADRRSATWCTDCDKCRFVCLILAPFMSPDALREIFGEDLLGDERHHEGFARLMGSGGHKPLECVGEERECLAAISLLAADPRWREHAVVRRLADELTPRRGARDADPAAILALSDDHSVPAELIGAVNAVLAA
jgi:hypothetical protein